MRQALEESLKDVLISPHWQLQHTGVINHSRRVSKGRQSVDRFSALQWQANDSDSEQQMEPMFIDHQ